jgi:hypothetical protein
VSTLNKPKVVEPSQRTIQRLSTTSAPASVRELVFTAVATVASLGLSIAAVIYGQAGNNERLWPGLAPIFAGFAILAGVFLALAYFRRVETLAGAAAVLGDLEIVARSGNTRQMDLDILIPRARYYRNLALGSKDNSIADKITEMTAKVLGDTAVVRSISVSDSPEAEGH